jgi:hypothetical protein
MFKTLRKIIRSAGFDLIRYPALREGESERLADLNDAQKRILERARPFTMTSVERMAALMDAVTHVSRHQIPGAIVECGVWRGGSMMTAALTLQALGDTSRDLYLYDTFEGMTRPGAEDRSQDNQPAADQFPGGREHPEPWCDASLEEVRANVLGTGYPPDRIHFIKGPVEQTIPGALPGPTALLRLDTDWYESTKHELRHLYPLLQPHGILLIDDYGHWQGARQAVDEYFAHHPEPVYLHRIDYTARAYVKGTSDK